MLTLHINNVTSGRFTNKRKVSVIKPFNTSNSKSIVTIIYTGVSWAVWYLAFIEKRQQDYINEFLKYFKTNRISSINNQSGDVYLLAGRGVALDMNEASYETKITIHNTMLNTRKSMYIAKIVKSDAVTQACNWIMRYQMCIYHFQNKALKRALLNGTNNIGYYYRFMAARARWNAYVYTSCINCNVVSSGDAIFITLGYNNNSEDFATPTITAQIEVNGKHKNLVWYGIFLSETSPTTSSILSNTPYNAETSQPVTYTIIREGAQLNTITDEQYDKLLKDSESGDSTNNSTSNLTDAQIERQELLKSRVWLPDVKAEASDTYDELEVPVPGFTLVHAPDDITNPNDCQWSRYGGIGWTSGKIIQECNLAPSQCCKNVYSISKHPAVTGYTKRSTAVTFNITITYEFGDLKIVREFNAIPCYMQVYADDNEIITNNGDPKRYILVASKGMGEPL